MGLDHFLKRLYDPTDPLYRQFITPQEFADRFGPTPAQYRTLQDLARAQGLQVTGTYANRLLVEVEGTTDQVERAFHVRLDDYRRPDGSLFFGPDRQPTLDMDLPASHIGGLDNESRPRPRLRRSSALARIPSPRAGGSGPGGTFIGSDFRNAYAPGVTLTGAGQSVALVEFVTYSLSEINTYKSQCSPPLSTPVSNIYLDSLNSSTPPDCSAANNYPEIEVVLDIEVAMAMAPGLSRVMVYMGDSPTNILNRMASDNNSRQISCSWGWSLTTSERATENTILAEFAAQGQSYFLASGDGDPNTGVGAFTTDPPYGGTPLTSFYANDSEITQVTVGATDLTMTGSGSTWSAEVPVNAGWQSTGGILAGSNPGDTIPSYQVGINMTANKGSTIYRNVPDISCAGLNCYVYDCTGPDNLGGTSASAPIWAAFMALVNQRAAALGKVPVGFPNPAFYTIGQGGNYTTDFNDITTGNNGSVTQFPAVAGYDLPTGWGSPKGQALIDDLVAPLAVATPTPTPTVTPTPTITPTPGPGFTVLAQPNTTDGKTPIQFQVYLPTPGRIILSIYNVAGESLYAVSVPGSTGWNLLPWAVRNQPGDPLASGIYVYYVQAGDGSGGLKKTGKIFVKH